MLQCWVCGGDSPVTLTNINSKIKEEEKAKVVAAVWGEEFIQFLVEVAVLAKTILNNRVHCTRMI